MGASGPWGWPVSQFRGKAGSSSSPTLRSGACRSMMSSALPSQLHPTPLSHSSMGRLGYTWTMRWDRSLSMLSAAANASSLSRPPSVGRGSSPTFVCSSQPLNCPPRANALEGSSQKLVASWWLEMLTGAPQLFFSKSWSHF